MKILTYNTWHGLNGKGVLRHGELEQPPRRRRRLETQVRKLRELGPHIAFLQEVNPLAIRLSSLRRELSLNGVGQNDLCGTKFWGRGIPVNLNSGLVILAAEELKKLRGVRLSGSKLSFAAVQFSFQWAESRYALIAELKTREFGRLLVANVHLHHGFEPSPPLLQKLQHLADEKTITEAQHAELVREMEHARARRHGEGVRLLGEISKIKDGYDGVILAGDMNTDPDSAVIDLIKGSGLIDIVPAGMHTWDQTRNRYNFELSEAFTLSVSDFGIAPLHHLLHDHDHRIARLDYIFVSKNLASRVRSVEMFGDDMPPEEITSDHFGIVAELG